MNKLPKIMVVDDEEYLVENIVDYFSAGGFEIKGYTHSSDALTAVKLVKPDVILLDIMMPEMDGYQFCRHLKADDELADIPVIFVTAKERQDDSLLFTQVGGQIFINKPFMLEELKTLVLLLTEYVAEE